MAPQADTSTMPASSGRRARIRIDVGVQAEGCTYALGPNAVAAIAERFPDARPARSIYVGYGTREAFEEAHGPMWEQIVTLLTGLTPERLAAHADVVVFDPATDKVLKKFPT